MNSNIELIEKFYSCFKERDGEGMAECYHENIQFSDPVFPDLKGAKAGAMWKMLCQQAQRFDLIYNNVQANEATGSAHWEATYHFSATGRRVHNKIDAEFEFRDGKIIKHHDSFSFWRWSSMALGPIGLTLGWSPMVKNKVQKQAAKNLEIFIKKAADKS